jgi:predicted permease
VSAPTALLARTLRTLRRSPGYVAITAASLGVGLGLSIAAFALVDTMLHPVTPFARVDALYRVQSYGGDQRHRIPIDGQLSDLRALGAVEAVTGAQFYSRDIEVGTTAFDALAVQVLPDFFDVLGIHPRLGRLPAPGAEAGRGVVVSDALWKRHFGNRAVIGDARVRIGGDMYAVVGVMPEGMHEPIWADLWIAGITENRLASDGYGRPIPIVRLRRGALLNEAVRQLAVYARALTAAHGAPEHAFSFELWSLRPNPLGLQAFHKAMLAAVISILLIACLNVSALTLARGLSRRRDYAVRLALGASRGALAREVLLEVAIVAAVAGIAGAIVGVWALGAFARLIPDQFTWMGIIEPHWSTRTFAIAFLTVLGAVAVAGGAPAVVAGRTDPSGPLKESAGTTTGRSGSTFGLLVIAELALSVVVLVGASLVTKATRAIATYDFGYDARGLSRVTYYVRRQPGVRDTVRANTRATITARDLVERVRSVPGVTAASLMMQEFPDDRRVASDRTVEGGAELFLADGFPDVGAGFLATLGVPLVEGRDFTEGDRAAGGAVILDQRAARILFPHDDPVGRRVKIGGTDVDAPWLPVIGVARDATLAFTADPDFERQPSLYASLPISHGSPSIVFRSDRGAPHAAVAAAQVVKSALPATSTVGVGPWSRNFAETLEARSFLSSVFVTLGAVSLLLAAVGLLSVLTFVVGQRMRELAVRMALGAQRRDIVRIVLRNSLEMALGGASIGAIFGMWGASALRAYLYGIEPTDAGALALAECVLVATTLLATIPAILKAMRANPVDVMRAT